MLGSGGVVVVDDAQCIVKFALRTMKFYQARELWMVHSLPRRHRLAEENSAAVSLAAAA